MDLIEAIRDAQYGPKLLDLPSGRVMLKDLEAAVEHATELGLEHPAFAQMADTLTRIALDQYVSPLVVVESQRMKKDIGRIQAGEVAYVDDFHDFWNGVADLTWITHHEVLLKLERYKSDEMRRGKQNLTMGVLGSIVSILISKMNEDACLPLGIPLVLLPVLQGFGAYLNAGEAESLVFDKNRRQGWIEKQRLFRDRYSLLYEMARGREWIVAGVGFAKDMAAKGYGFAELLTDEHSRGQYEMLESLRRNTTGFYLGAITYFVDHPNKAASFRKYNRSLKEGMHHLHLVLGDVAFTNINNLPVETAYGLRAEFSLPLKSRTAYAEYYEALQAASMVLEPGLYAIPDFPYSIRIEGMRREIALRCIRVDP